MSDANLAKSEPPSETELPIGEPSAPREAVPVWMQGLIGGVVLGALVGAAGGWYARGKAPPPTRVVYRDRPVPVLARPAPPPKSGPAVSTPPAGTAVPKAAPAGAGAPAGKIPPKPLAKRPPPLGGGRMRDGGAPFPVPTPFLGPALPAVSGTIAPIRPGEGDLGVAPNPKMAEQEVRQVAAASGATVVSSTPAGGGRAITLSVSEGRAANLVSRLRSTLGTRGTVSEPYPVVSASDTTSPAARLRILEKRLKDLKTERQKLLVDFLPDAQPVQEVERQIAETEKSLGPLRKRAGKAGSATMRVQVVVGG